MVRINNVGKIKRIVKKSKKNETEIKKKMYLECTHKQKKTKKKE